MAQDRREEAYEPPLVEDLGTLQDLTGTKPPPGGKNETGVPGLDKS